MITAGLTLAAGGAVVTPRSFTSALLPRVLGVYIAACAGAVQVLDIAVERLGLDDRVFTFAIVLAVIGIPFAGTGAAILDTARADRRPIRQRRDPAPAAERASSPAAAPSAAPSDAAPDAAAAINETPTAPAASDLPRRLELALSYRRIAELHEAADNHTDAASHRARASIELQKVIDELKVLIESG